MAGIDAFFVSYAGPSSLAFLPFDRPILLLLTIRYEVSVTDPLKWALVVWGELTTLSWELPYNDARRMYIMPTVSHITHRYCLHAHTNPPRPSGWRNRPRPVRNEPTAPGDPPLARSTQSAGA